MRNSSLVACLKQSDRNAVMAGSSTSGQGSRRSLGVPETISISHDDPLRDLFEACKHGDVGRVRLLVTTQNVNARDTAGRKSSPLHFAAGGFVGWFDLLLNEFGKGLCDFPNVFPSL